MRIRLTSRWVLGYSSGDHALIENGEVIVADDVVERVGPPTESECARTYSYGDALIAPGFIDLNALADADCTILRYDSSAAKTRTIWSREYAERSRDVLSWAEQLRSAHAAFAQLLLAGITTALPVTSLLHRAWAESEDEFFQIAELADVLGIRLYLGPSYRSAVNVIEPDGEIGQRTDEERGFRGLRDAIRFVERVQARAHPLVRGLLVPSTIETSSDALLRETSAASADLEVPFRLHCCQSQVEAELVWKRSGQTSIGLLRALDVLGPRALLPHALDLGGPRADPSLVEQDVDAFAQSRAVVVHCPLVVGRGGRRLQALGTLLTRGVLIGLGTDTAPPDMLMNLQIGVAMARCEPSTAAVGPAEFLRSATLHCAKALGREDLGRLQPGSAADIVVWDLSSLHVKPVHDPVQALFLMPPGRRARDVFVAGRQVVRDARLINVDEEALGADLQTIFNKLRAAYPERHPDGSPWPEMFPSTFPMREFAMGQQL
jgi:cytosine/adenosine deaminase-related metal-dependent hydrolase